MPSEQVTFCWDDINDTSFGHTRPTNNQSYIYFLVLAHLKNI